MESMSGMSMPMSSMTGMDMSPTSTGSAAPAMTSQSMKMDHGGMGGGCQISVKDAAEECMT